MVSGYCRTMSTVVIQVGQCGNQLGLEWWKLIASDPGQSRDILGCPFSSRDGKLAAVFIDSEPKVLQGAKQFIKNKSADGLLLFHNDKALTFAQTLERVPRSTESLSPVMPTVGSLTVMNTHIASCMAGLLLPVKSLTPTSGWSLGSEPWELIRSVCPIPAAKLLHTTQAYSSVRTQWDRLATSSLQAVPQLSSTGKPYSSRAVLAVARGNNDNSFHLSNVLEKLRKGHRCVSWNPFPIDHWADTNNRLGDSPSSRLLTVCSNHSSVSSLLDHVVQRSKEMLRVNAYFHWYQRYGVEELDFELALETCSAIIQEYGC
ncbi:uncharacterized protein LOC139924756 [Centroberyx gerrardi]